MAQDAKTSCAIFHYILKNLSFYAEKVDIMTDTIKALTLNPRPAEQVGDFTLNKTNCLRDLNGLGDFLLRCGLRHGDG